MAECDAAASAQGDAVDLVAELRRCRPAADAPVRVWVSWLTRHAELCDVLATEAPVPEVAGDALWMADRQRRMAKELEENYQPNDMWPGAASW